MNTITIHCEYALKAPMDPTSVLNPPVDIVVSACAAASKSVISPNSNKIAWAILQGLRRCGAVEV